MDGRDRGLCDGQTATWYRPIEPLRAHKAAKTAISQAVGTGLAALDREGICATAFEGGQAAVELVALRPVAGIIVPCDTDRPHAALPHGTMKIDSEESRSPSTDRDEAAAPRTPASPGDDMRPVILV